MAITLSDETRSHRDYKRQWQFTDGDPDSPTYGQLIDFTGAFIAVAIEDKHQYPCLLATTDNGKITIVSTGVIEIDFTASDMNLLPGSYKMGGYYQINGETDDLLEGDLTVQRGIPRP